MITQIRYSVPYLAALALVFTVLIVTGASIAGRLWGENAFVGAVFMLFGVLGLPTMVRYLFSGGVVLEYEDSFVTYHGIFGSKTLHWCQVKRMNITVQGGRDSNRVLKLEGPFSVFASASIHERLLRQEHRPLEALQEELLAAFEGDHAENPLSNAELAHVLRKGLRADRERGAINPSFPSQAGAPELTPVAKRQSDAMPDTRSRGVIGEVPGAMPGKRGFFGRRN